MRVLRAVPVDDPRVSRGRTLPQLLRDRAHDSGASPAIRSKRAGVWRTLAWSEVNRRVRQYAAGLALSKLRQRPQGKRRLRQSLSQKKLDKETIDKAIASAFEKLPETDLIDREIEKRIRLKGVPQTRDEIKKFYDHLVRRGFGYDLVSTKLREISKVDPDQNVPHEIEKAAQ